MTLPVVRFPAQRRELMYALASLADREYQERVWVRGEMPHPDYFDELPEAVSILYDDTRVLPSPEEMVGYVTIDGDEVPRLRRLGELLGPLLDRHGVAPVQTYLADSAWPDVLAAASAALAAVVNAGALFSDMGGGQSEPPADDAAGD